MTPQWFGDTDSLLIEMTLRPVPEGTELLHPVAPPRRSHRHEKGWTGSLDKLEALFA